LFFTPSGQSLKHAAVFVFALCKVVAARCCAGGGQTALSFTFLVNPSSFGFLGSYPYSHLPICLPLEGGRRYLD